MNIPLGEWSGSDATKDLEKTFKSEGKKKFVFDLIMLFVAVIAIGVSIKSCRISEEAEKSANEALDISKFQFLQVNRPYIILSPKKFDNGQYWKITQEGSIIRVALKYEVNNVGNVAAKDIKLPEKIGLGPRMKLNEGAPVYYQKMGKVTLGPGDSFSIEPNIVMGYKNEEVAKEQFEHLISDKSYGADFLLSVNYTNELDETQKYRTFIQNRIHKNKAQLIKSEMLNLNDTLLKE